MNYSEALQQNRTQRRSLDIAFALLTALIVSACSSSDSSGQGTTEVNEQFPQASENPLESTQTETDDETPVVVIPEMGMATETVDDNKFPAAPIDSGPENLIVTGFDSSNADATSPWLVNSRLFRLNSRLDSTGDAIVELLQYNDDFPVSRHVDFYTLELDTCEVNDPDAVPTGEGGGDDGGSPPPSLSGGETVVINTPSGPWFTLNRTIDNGQIEYSVNDGLPAELLPAGATLSIPGDEFPTVASHPLYDPTEPPVRLLPDANEPVNVNSAYAWIPSNEKTFMRILLLAYDNTDNSFVDFAVGCDVRDDGAFTMPTEVLDFISTTPYRLQARFDRAYSRVDFVNGIVIRQFSEISE